MGLVESLLAAAHGDAHPPIEEPWFAALIIALARYRQRQAVLMTACEDGSVVSGRIPGEEGWRVVGHGGGRIEFLGLRGERVSLVQDDSGVCTEAETFARRVVGVEPSAIPELEVRHWFRDVDAIVAAMSALTAVEGALVRASAPDAFHLGEALLRHLDAVAALTLHGRTVPDDEARTAFEGWLVDHMEGNRAFAGAMIRSAWVWLGPERRDPLVAAILDGPLDETTVRFVRVLSRVPDLDHPAVARVFMRLGPSSDPVTVAEVCGYIARRGPFLLEAIDLLDSTATRMVGDGNDCDALADVVIALLELAPDRGVEQIRVAFESCFTDMMPRIAAALGGLDRPWCRQLLLEGVAEEAQLVTAAERETTFYFAAVLRQSYDPETRAQGEKARRDAGGIRRERELFGDRDLMQEHRVLVDELRETIDRLAQAIPKRFDPYRSRRRRVPRPDT